jgi:hypothetical protein
LARQLPDKWKEVAELYAGCITGAIQKQEYLSIIEEAGFVNIQIQKEKAITLPDDVLGQYLTPEEAGAYKADGSRIESITVYGEKASKDERNCCEPDSKCC